jgi:hypothetical protein
MKSLLILIIMSFSFFAIAHDGGHGEVEEGGKYGGITSPVVSKAEEGLGSKAKTLFKAELVRAESGKLSLYLFDGKMNLLKLDQFESEVEANLEVKKKGKFVYVGQFKLTKNGNHFTGQLPKIDYKPFNIDLFLSSHELKLFSGFSNLD